MALLVAVAVMMAASIGAASANAARQGSQTPRLGVASHDLQGYGQARPTLISDDGDGTSEVLHIHWTDWGASKAVGTGKAVWVWPGSCTGCNGLTSAPVVAFNLGRCHGHRSYNALEWYFPQYEESFEPHQYYDTCSHSEVGVSNAYSPVSCPDTSLAGEGTATEVSAENMSCEAASQLIAELPAGPFAHERRFEQSGFRCGTEGSYSGPDEMDCAQGKRWVVYSASW